VLLAAMMAFLGWINYRECYTNGSLSLQLGTLYGENISPAINQYRKVLSKTRFPGLQFASFMFAWGK